MTDFLWNFISGFGEGWYPLFLTLTAMIETIFPPFPGDVIFIALAGLGSSRGVPEFVLWLSGFTGCFISTLALDAMGRSTRLERLEKIITGSPGSMDRAGDIVERRGPWVIVFSRFIPGIRSVLVVAAAAAGMKRPVVLFSAGLSAALWYLLMVVAGRIAGSGIESARGFMSNLTLWLWLGVLVALSAGCIILMSELRRRKK